MAGRLIRNYPNIVVYTLVNGDLKVDLMMELPTPSPKSFQSQPESTQVQLKMDWSLDSNTSVNSRTASAEHTDTHHKSSHTQSASRCSWIQRCRQVPDFYLPVHTIHKPRDSKNTHITNHFITRPFVPKGLSKPWCCVQLFGQKVITT